MIIWMQKSSVLLVVVLLHYVQNSQCAPHWWRWHPPPAFRHSQSKPDIQYSIQFRIFQSGKALLFRGGSLHDEDGIPEPPDDADISTDEPMTMNNETIGATRKHAKRKIRHTSDMILDLGRRSGVSENDESLELRRLTTARAREYMNDLMEAAETGQKLPHPRKLLHYLAPKVPAIKHSPDVNLRIRSARADMGSGVAACMIGTLAHVCEIYDKEVLKRAALTGESTRSAAPEITRDRRFEQLVECVLSGVNIEKRKRESLTQKLDWNSDEAADIEEILDEEDAQVDEGLNVRDGCRAAWGMTILGVSHLETMGGVMVQDLFLALSLRIRELLLARLQRLRRDDLYSESSGLIQSTEDRLDEVAEELAEDASSTMWAFACVKACTGMQSSPLFEACCSILCQDPVEMRKRAQEADRDSENSAIGSNDAVDRLARSEAGFASNSGPVSDSRNATQQNAHKDALLDWLSQNEVNDVLWALALHGSPVSTLSTDEVTLSETASALREIAFDRMLTWLNDDLDLLRMSSQNRQAKDSSPFPASPSEEDVITVEVVDAAILLASQEDVQPEIIAASINDMPVENLTLRTGQHSSDGENIQEYQVVDAAKLLASIDGDDPVEVETEIMIAPSTLANGGSGEESGSQETGQIDEEVSNGTTISKSLKPNTKAVDPVLPPSLIFSPHNLASVAWSVTELRDPLRVRIVDIVIQIFGRLGSTSIDSLKGADLSNLAWAVSRYEAALEGIDRNSPSPISLSILCWVARASTQRMKEAPGGDSKFPSFHSFQPPELGRLVWAIASTVSTYSNVSHDVKRDPFVCEVAFTALRAAASNLSLFATEDLVRISWAFLELCDGTTVISDPDVASALGGVLATVEESLHRWERGIYQGPPHDDDDYQLSDDASRFSSFFGKSRLNPKLLDQRIGDRDDDDDESTLAPLLARSHLPMLRDLTVDPSTLCKAACGFARLSAEHPYITGSWTLTRVAVRLLSSKDARLMKECSIHDIVRLCEAAVLSEVAGHGRELVIGLFARKVVCVLNDALDTSDPRKAASSIDVARASSTEIATLLWTLGELGVKHSLPDETRHSAHKRMRLVTEKRLLTRDQLKTLDTPSIVRLLRGLVAMKFVASDRVFLLDVLFEIENRSKDMKSAELCCDLAESIAVVKDAVDTATTRVTKSVKEQPQRKELNTTETKSPLPEEDTRDSEDGAGAPPVVGDASIDTELSRSCDSILVAIAAEAGRMSTELRADEIRRLLMVYSLLPFQADDLIGTLDGEISKRGKHLKSSRDVNVGALLREAATNTSAVNTILFDEPAEDSRINAIKNGIKSFFRYPDSDGTEDGDEEKKISELLSEMIQNSAASTLKAAQILEEIGSASLVTPDDVIQNLGAGAAFELGRCKELIESYRRIEFSDGTRRSRYGKGRKDIAKRVLSRLMP